MQNHSEYTIKTAAYRSRCFVCDETIQQGENYVEIDDEKVCVTCGLPARRLRPLKKETSKQLTNG
ncbi:MAG: hypothetical protein BWY95_00447 [Bacteroidetes bacterium ADurb.BinA104]|nr:MAG: hypothetical protein BWY95_00447 [Bacteroidetes bacterium ADurb.BinA104]